MSALSLFVFFGSKLFKAYGAKYRYAEAIDEIGEENIKFQEYDYKLSILTITYTKNGEELNRCIRLENMLVRYKNNVDGIIINFDTNEIIKPRIIIGGPDSGKKRLSGGEEE